MNNRRKLVIGLGAGALTTPLVCFAQPKTKIWRIGYLAFLMERTREEAFREALREYGYVEGQTVHIEWRDAGASLERLVSHAAALATLGVDLIVTSGSPATLAAYRATKTIPVVMTNVSDPVDLGVIKSLSRPGGNVTGTTNINADLIEKHFEFALEIRPGSKYLAVLQNPDNPAHSRYWAKLEDFGRRRGIKMLPVWARSRQDISDGFAQLANQGAAPVIVRNDPVLRKEQAHIIELASKYRFVSVAPYIGFAIAGGVMAYGPSDLENVRRTAYYVDRIFKGTKPSELPVEQSTKFEMVVNMKTAKTLGIKIPQIVLVRANKVIE